MKPRCLCQSVDIQCIEVAANTLHINVIFCEIVLVKLYVSYSVNSEQNSEIMVISDHCVL